MTRARAKANALLLAARKLPGPSLGLVRKLGHFQHRLNSLASLGTRHFPHPQAKFDVLPHRHVREQRVLLKDHPGSSVLLWCTVDRQTVDDNRSGVRPVQAADQPQQRGLTATAGPEQGNEFVLSHVERHAADSVHRPKALVHIAKLDVAAARGAGFSQVRFAQPALTSSQILCHFGRSGINSLKVNNLSLFVSMPTFFKTSGAMFSIAIALADAYPLISANRGP